MDCQALRDDLMDVLYGEADQGARQRVAEHQRVCATCREELAALRGVRRDLAAWELPKARPLPGPWTRWLPLAAGLLVAIGGLGAGHLRTTALADRIARLEAERGGAPARADVVPVSHVERLLADSEARQSRRLADEMASRGVATTSRRSARASRTSRGRRDCRWPGPPS
jgi:hypothetical protein